MSDEIKLITGYSGKRHITPDDDAGLLKAVIGNGALVLNDIKATIQSNNEILISPCELLINGRHIRIITPKTVNIENGIIGSSRTDSICLKYTINDNVENVDIEVVKGRIINDNPNDFGISNYSKICLATVSLYGININDLDVKIQKHSNVDLQNEISTIQNNMNDLLISYQTKQVFRAMGWEG